MGEAYVVVLRLGGGLHGEYSSKEVHSLLALAAMVPVSRCCQGSCYSAWWEHVVTPFHLKQWEIGLVGHVDRDFVANLRDGIRDGFRIGFVYRMKVCRSVTGNMRSVEKHRDVLQVYVDGGRQAGRVLGPFDRDQFPMVQVGPFGVIPKSEPSKWRLILDLSSTEGFSVNDGVDKDLCSLSYMSVDEVAERVVEVGKGALLAKFDLKAAYRNVPVHPEDRWLLGMVWGDKLYVDSVLPFGLRSAPAIVNAVAEGLSFVIRSRGVGWLRHYLEDIIIVGPPGSGVCGDNLSVALDTCSQLGVPVAAEKTVGPATVVTFLGVEMDTVEMELRLPLRKLEKLKELVALWRVRKGCRKRDLQSLAGHLSHACKVVRPGRRFLRGIFGLLSQFRRKDHFVWLNASFRADLEWWHAFVSEWNGMALLQGVELEKERKFGRMLRVHGGVVHCGMASGCRWHGVSGPVFGSANISAKELLPIVVAAATWGYHWRGQVVVCHCDNQAVVAALRGGYCREMDMAFLLRCLFFLEARYDLVLQARFIPGVENSLADAISRNRLDVLFDLYP